MAAADPLTLLDERLRGWRPDHVGTLLFMHRADRLLLIRKKRGHGAGKINAPGGKVQEGETPLAAALRETQEEVGLRPAVADERARFRFVEMADAQWAGHVFVASAPAGEPRETDEASPAWYPRDALPFDEMWEDDRIWLPRLLAGERLIGDFLFDAGKLLAHRLSTWTGEAAARW